jgi:hypothetical protein
MTNYKSIDEAFMKYTSLKSEADNIIVNHKKVLENYRKTKEEEDMILEAIELNKELIQENADNFINTVEGLLTLAVRRIFYDVDNPRVVIEVRDGARPMASMYYVYIDVDGTEVKADIRKAVGGGVRGVIGFVLQTFFISYYKKERVVLADEAFKELSKQYRPYFIQFLKELCDNHKFKICLITNDDDIIDVADYVYAMVDGVLMKVGADKK